MKGSIPRDFTPKKAVLSGIALFASLMMLLSLSFALIGSVNGFLVLGFSVYFSDSYQWGAILIGVLCLFQMLVSLGLIFGNVMCFLFATRKASTSIALVSAIVYCIFSFFDLIEGIVLAVMLEGPTIAFLPLIFAIMILVVFCICKTKIAEENTATSMMYAYDPVTGQPIALSTVQPDSTPTNAGTEEGTAQDTLSPDKADMLLMNFKSFIPEEKVPAFRYALGKASAGCYTALSMVPLKNPMTVLLFSIFLGGFGVDRFYIGDTGMGVAKLLVGGLTLGIWPLVDIFMCYKKAKEQNFDLLMSALRVAR